MVAPSASFFENLKNYFTSGERNRLFRQCSRGIFVHEDGLEPLLDRYQQWLQEATGSESNKSREKCLKRLAGTTELELVYLLDGNACLPGYIIPSALERSNQSGLSWHPGSPLDSKSYLHPRDPIFGRLAGIEAQQVKQHGLVIALPGGRDAAPRLRVHEDALKQFARCAREVKPVLREFPRLAGALRDCIEPLAAILAGAKKVKNRDRLLVPERFRANASASFLRRGALVFVAEGEGEGRVISHCYALYGNALKEFVGAELQLLRSEAARRKLRGLELSGEKDRYLFKVRAEKLPFRARYQLLREFISYAPASKSLSTKFAKRFSVADCLEEIAALFRASRRVDGREVSRRFADKVSGAAQLPLLRFRKSGDWIFAIEDKNVLCHCVDLGGAKKRRRKRSAGRSSPARVPAAR